MDACAASDQDNMEDEEPAGSCGAPDPQASGHMPDSPQPRVPHCLDLKDAQAVQADVEGIEAPRFIPEWILSESATRLLEQLSKLAAQRLDAILSHRFAEISQREAGGAWRAGGLGRGWASGGTYLDSSGGACLQVPPQLCEPYTAVGQGNAGQPQSQYGRSADLPY